MVAKLEHQPPIDIIGDWLQFEALRNAGAAFGFGEAFTVIFTVIAAGVIVVDRPAGPQALQPALGHRPGPAARRRARQPHRPDLPRARRVPKGAVVDFIAPAHFAVFNLADSAIVCGGILIVLLSFRGLDPDGTVHKD